MPPERSWTPRTYVRSLKDRAKNTSDSIGVPANELVELHYHRRLLARVFHAAPDQWVLKGGQALLMRWPTAPIPPTSTCSAPATSLKPATKPWRRACASY